jgi:Uma2 family endonuclease
MKSTKTPAKPFAFDAPPQAPEPVFRIPRPTQPEYTYADLQLLENERYELIDGELIMSPSPDLAHQRLALAFAIQFQRHFEQHPVAEVVMAPHDVVLTRRLVLQPDLYLVLNAHRERLTERACIGPPDIVIEIVSPGNTAKEIRRKQHRYEEHGVPELWYAHPHERWVRQLANHEATGFQVVAERKEPEAAITTALLPGLEIPLAKLWAYLDR